MTGTLPAIPFDYLSLSDAASVLGVTPAQLVHAGGTGRVQICANLYLRLRSIAMHRQETDDEDGAVSEESEAEWRAMVGDAEFERQQNDYNEHKARCTLPMPDGVYELLPDDVRAFEVPETEAVEIFEVLKFNEKGWWDCALAERHDDESGVSVCLTDLVILREQLARLLVPESVAVPHSADMEKPLSTRERNNLLRIIRALEVMAKLPSEGYAQSIITQLQTLGFSAPSDDTIRKAINSARDLDS